MPDCTLSRGYIFADDEGKDRLGFTATEDCGTRHEFVSELPYPEFDPTTLDGVRVRFDFGRASEPGPAR